MSDLSQQKGIVILQNLKLPESLDFDFLRREGLKHIGNFSGKLWTDHNAHDPGITILEALCYALVDLGYRTQLPVADLLAPPTTENGAEKTKEDNFLTPAEILTINPVTITDFRKLLLEIEGVRNAWLEPLDISAPTLFYRENNCQLECRSTPSNEALIDGEYRLSPLNGLYRVYIELADSSLLQAVENNCLPAKGKEEAFDAILHEIKATLSAHRNLCEDFEEIVVLCPKEIPFCADIELREGADPDQAFFEIARKLREFFSPSPRFYSLQELLDQGKDIEDIYAGRPYALPDLDTVLPKNASQKKPCQPGIDCKAPEASAKRQSYGFIDTEELEKLERRRAVRLSDLYTVLHGIEAVESVRNLCF